MFPIKWSLLFFYVSKRTLNKEQKFCKNALKQGALKGAPCSFDISGFAPEACLHGAGLGFSGLEILCSQGSAFWHFRLRLSRDLLAWRTVVRDLRVLKNNVPKGQLYKWIEVSPRRSCVGMTCWSREFYENSKQVLIDLSVSNLVDPASSHMLTC